MEIVILPTPAEVGRLAARKIAQVITRKPTAVIGLATGSSPLAIYAELAASGARRRCWTPGRCAAWPWTSTSASPPTTPSRTARCSPGR